MGLLISLSAAFTATCALFITIIILTHINDDAGQNDVHSDHE